MIFEIKMIALSRFLYLYDCSNEVPPGDNTYPLDIFILLTKSFLFLVYEFV